MILRYEQEVRAVLVDVAASLEVREVRVGQDGTWRTVGAEFHARWGLGFGAGDFQSLGATLCHVAAERLDEDPDKDPWS